MKLEPSVLEANYEDLTNRITKFIKNYINNCNAKGITLGLSGGIDSCTVAALSALSVGGEKVLALILPEQETYNKEDIKDAEFIAEKFRIKTKICDITQIIESFYENLPNYDSKNIVAKGNIKARARMVCIYYYANKSNMIVCGGSDKSEAMMGYFTKWGDAAADISPIMDLYKTQVRGIAKHLGFPDKIANKQSTPALWPNQSAENELGIKYGTLDLILYGIEHFLTPKEIANQLKLEKKIVEEIKNRWSAMEHKRRMPLAPKLEYRTIGADFRLAYNKKKENKL